MASFGSTSFLSDWLRGKRFAAASVSRELPGASGRRMIPETDIRRQRMSVEEYQLLPFHPGWKVEYMGGEAIFQPREAVAHATLATSCCPSVPAPNGVVLQTPDESDAAALEQLFYSAFIDTPEYAGWPRESFALEPAEQVRRFFSAESAAPLGASRIAVVRKPGADDGAALLHACGSAEAWLDVLMVAPTWQRRGVASILVGDALAALAAADIHRLVSRWHLASEPSIFWHRKLGFVEVPDLFNARLYYRAAQSELWRLDQLDELTPERRSLLLDEENKWKREAARLQALLDAGDKAGAFACFRF
jgi:GNAT superfamily N-acetyltransferase